MKRTICGLLLASFLAFDVPVYAQQVVPNVIICKPTTKDLVEFLRVEPQKAKAISDPSDPTGEKVLILGVLNPNEFSFFWNYNYSPAHPNGMVSIDVLRQQADPKGYFEGKVVNFMKDDNAYCAYLESNFTDDAWKAYESIQKQMDQAEQAAKRLNEQYVKNEEERRKKLEEAVEEEVRKDEQDRADYRILEKALKNQDFVLSKPCCFGFCRTRTEEGRLYRKGDIAQIVQHPTFKKMIKDEKKLKKIKSKRRNSPKEEEMI